jgi:hypothetical protein
MTASDYILSDTIAFVSNRLAVNFPALPKNRSVRGA